MMSGKPFRMDSESLKDYDLFVDLDALETRKTGFILHGVPRIISPITTLNFFKTSNSMARIQALARQERITVGDAKAVYLELFTTLCTPFTPKDLDDMTQHQCAALVQTIEDHFIGRYKKEIEKKKI